MELEINANRGREKWESPEKKCTDCLEGNQNNQGVGQQATEEDGR